MTLNITTDNSDDAFSLFKLYFLSWFMPGLLIIGFLGTSLNLYIIIHHKIFQKTTSILFASLAIADLINLVFAAVYLYVSVFWGYDPMTKSLVTCYSVPYLEAIGYWLSPWIQATISFQRMLAIKSPFKVRQLLTAHRTGVLVLSVSFLVILYALVIPLNHEWTKSPDLSVSSIYQSSESLNYSYLVTNHSSFTIEDSNNANSTLYGCSKQEGRQFVIYYSHAVFGSFIPFLVMIICTCLIIYFICQNKKTVNRTITSQIRQMSMKQRKYLTKLTSTKNTNNSSMVNNVGTTSNSSMQRDKSETLYTDSNYEQQNTSATNSNSFSFIKNAKNASSNRSKHSKTLEKRNTNSTKLNKKLISGRSSEKRITFMLILMNLTYFLTNGVAGLFLVTKVHLQQSQTSNLLANNEELNDHNSSNEFNRIWTMLHKFADVIACINNATNWIFYLLSGKQFREKFLSILNLRQCCCSSSRDNTLIAGVDTANGVDNCETSHTTRLSTRLSGKSVSKSTSLQLNKKVVDNEKECFVTLQVTTSM